jgi:two-component system, chemotaxis family, CheB/CheR fusion protein
MATFHYCLNRPGFLVVGRSESVGSCVQFFTLADRENKIYARSASRSVLHFTAAEKSQSAPPQFSLPSSSRPPFDLTRHVDATLLTRYAPPGVVLNDKLEVLQFRGRTGPYFEAAAGQPQLNVLKMAREGLLVPLRAALAQAQKQHEPVRKKDLEVGEQGAITHCDLVVIPLPPPPGSTERLYAVLFEERTAPLLEGKSRRAAQRPTSEVTRLRGELQTAKEYQQSLLEEHNRVNDDLATANQELISSNEELQSINEELQTAKEELQSTNEELTTVNDELRSGNRELNLVNTDLVNLLNTVELAIIFVDAERKVRRFTPQAQSIFNVVVSDIGRPIDEIKLKVDVPDLDAQIAWSISNVTVRESQVQDQLGRWFRMQIRPYQTSEGQVDGALLSLMDIDLLKRHADEAEWSRDYAVSIVDAVVMPLVVLDEGLQVISANEAFYDTFGTTHEEMESRSFFARSEWNILPLRMALTALFTQGTPVQIMEVEAVFPLVGKRTLSFAARAVHFRNSRPMVLLAIEDVSVRKQAEVERRMLLRAAQQARENAEQANRTKDAFLATLSHELRTPIATILMNAQLLRHPDLGAAKIQRISEGVERSAKTQSRLIEDLLDVSRIVTGKLSLELDRLNLLDVVPSVIETIALQAEKKKITVESKLDPRTGPISGDSPRLQQVISNLLINAVKFTPEGGTVTVTLTSERGEALLTVSDTGKGIAPEFLPFVFERFSQQENSSVRKFGGLGLGLSIVRDIVALHGGSVRATSEGAGKGATFTVILPLVREE